FLAERNLAFRGSVEKIENPHNGNFVGIIELLKKFDPEEHLRRISNKDINEDCLSKNVQNELLNIMGNAVQSKIITQIKSAKYVAVILDCTPDVSHQEQMSLTLRHVSDVNFMSKEFHSETIDISAALSLFEKLLCWLTKYRDSGFEQVLIGVKELTEELETTAEFQSKRLQKTKKQFNYEGNDEPIVDPKEVYRVECFNQVLDNVELYLETRLEQLKKHTKLYGFLGRFQNCKKEELEKHAADLEVALTDYTLSQREESVDLIKATDLDGHMLVAEMETFKLIFSSKYYGNPSRIFQFFSENDRATAFPNFFIALRIYLTIPVIVASGERTFLTPNLIKTYLRSTMSQYRLNSLAILSIESRKQEI
ncbi:hypothetical protein ILUMI_04373, partial [Ignelater luminosus]